MRDTDPRPACTCMPLNRALMAHLLKVEPGSVHEQGCVEQAVAAERARYAALVAAARRLLRVDYVTDAGFPLSQEEERSAWPEYHEARAALSAAIQGSAEP